MTAAIVVGMSTRFGPTVAVPLLLSVVIAFIGIANTLALSARLGSGATMAS